MTSPRIPYGWHQMTADDIAAVVSVLRHGQLTQGEQVALFERELSAYCGAKYGVACNSGSSALHLACQALGLKPGDSLWTAALTFVASASCGLHCGASVELVDIEPETGNLSIRALEEKLWQARRAGCLPRILVPVHYAGRPCDMRAIGSLAAEFGFAVIEDAAHALGATELQDADSRIGNARHGDAVAFSFHPVKLLTTGEGGMVMTNDPLLAERVARLRSQDIQRPQDQARPDWHYEIRGPGFNFRLSDIQAALGRSQLRRIDRLLERRRALARRYHERLNRDRIAGDRLKLPLMDADDHCAWHLYRVQCATSATRHRVFHALHRAGIGVQVHYQPLYRLALFAERGWRPEQFPGAEAFYAGALSLPLFPDLSEATQDDIISAVGRALADA